MFLKSGAHLHEGFERLLFPLQVCEAEIQKNCCKFIEALLTAAFRKHQSSLKKATQNLEHGSQALGARKSTTKALRLRYVFPLVMLSVG